MKRRLAIAMCAAVALSGAAFAADAPELKNDKEKISYSIGMDIGGNLKRGSVDVDPDLLAKGLKDSYGGGRRSSPRIRHARRLRTFRRR